MTHFKMMCMSKQVPNNQYLRFIFCEGDSLKKRSSLTKDRNNVCGPLFRPKAFLFYTVPFLLNTIHFSWHCSFICVAVWWNLQNFSNFLLMLNNIVKHILFCNLIHISFESYVKISKWVNNCEVCSVHRIIDDRMEKYITLSSSSLSSIAAPQWRIF